MYFGRKGCRVLFYTERAVHISVDCYDTAGSGHLELEIGIVWHRIESRKCSSSKQCVVTTAKRDDVED